MRTVTNCFLVNLAIADLLMATLNGAPNFVFLVTAHWPFGSATCTASNFTANLTVSAGVFTLVAITVDRYVTEGILFLCIVITIISYTCIELIIKYL
jgi:hypothetical protein